MIQHIDAMTVARAMRAVAAHGDVGAGRPRVEINLSGSSIGDPEMLRVIERELQRDGPGSQPRDLRDHRDRGDREHRPRARVLRSARQARLPLRAGRLRRRLRLLLLPQARALRHPEDRRRVRARLLLDAHRSPRHPVRRRHRPRPGQGDDRRARRRRRDGRAAARASASPTARAFTSASRSRWRASSASCTAGPPRWRSRLRALRGTAGPARPPPRGSV